MEAGFPRFLALTHLVSLFHDLFRGTQVPLVLFFHVLGLALLKDARQLDKGYISLLPLQLVVVLVVAHQLVCGHLKILQQKNQTVSEVVYPLT